MSMLYMVLLFLLVWIILFRFGIGKWFFGIKAYRFEDLPGFSGSGSLYCAEFCSRSELLQRVLVLAVILAALFFLNLKFGAVYA